MIDIEICLPCDDLVNVPPQIRAAHKGKAVRVELCSHMEHQGLTPSMNAMQQASAAAQGELILLAMIRPRGGDFCYDEGEILQMQHDIALAAQAGMQGVVLGALTPDNKLDQGALTRLIAVANNANLQVTFHRAFDALAEPAQAIDTLIELGVQRILTSGCDWRSHGTAQQHSAQLAHYLALAKGQIEIVIGGGIAPVSAKLIAQAIGQQMGQNYRYSFHAYSSALIDGVVHEDPVRQLYQGVNDT